MNTYSKLIGFYNLYIQALQDQADHKRHLKVGFFEVLQARRGVDYGTVISIGASHETTTILYFLPKLARLANSIYCNTMVIPSVPMEVEVE